MNFQVVLEKADEDGYLVRCPALPGCISQGETKKEAVANIKEAIECYLESMEKGNLAAPPAMENPGIISVKV